MKKVGKRLFSAFLSLVMVVTLIPFRSMTAYADTSLTEYIPTNTVGQSSFMRDHFKVISDYDTDRFYRKVCTSIALSN